MHNELFLKRLLRQINESWTIDARQFSGSEFSSLHSIRTCAHDAQRDVCHRRATPLPAQALMNRANTAMHKNTVPADTTEATVDPDFAVLGSIAVERGPIADLAVTAD